MNVNWEGVLSNLLRYAPDANTLLPPCNDIRIDEIESELGRMPEQIRKMLHYFNGAELFIRNIPMITIFGVSDVLPSVVTDWATDWWIDKFTPAWRAAHHREKDWVIAITNYDGLSVLDEEGIVREWNRGEHRWGPTDADLAVWIERVLKEGEEYMAERE